MSEYVPSGSQENVESTTAQQPGYKPEKRARLVDAEKNDLSTELPEGIIDRPILLYREKYDTLEVVDNLSNPIYVIESSTRALKYLDEEIERERSTSAVYLDRLETIRKRIQQRLESEN